MYVARCMLTGCSGIAYAPHSICCLLCRKGARVYFAPGSGRRRFGHSKSTFRNKRIYGRPNTLDSLITTVLNSFLLPFFCFSLCLCGIRSALIRHIRRLLFQSTTAAAQVPKRLERLGPLRVVPHSFSSQSDPRVSHTSIRGTTAGHTLYTVRSVTVRLVCTVHIPTDEDAYAGAVSQKKRRREVEPKTKGPDESVTSCFAAR